jgi:hypothetical protein
MEDVVEETGLTGAIGETSFLSPRPAPLAAAPPPALEREPEPEPEPRPFAFAQSSVVSRPRRPAAATGNTLGRLVRTSVSLYEHDQSWLKDVAERRGSVGVRRASKDFVARGLIRAIVELDPPLDLSGITLDTEDEFVERVKMALLDLNG